MNTKSPEQRGRSHGRYRVVAVRSLRRVEEQVQGTFELGPYRSRLKARFVAWLNRYSSERVVQRCTVEQITDRGE